MRNLAPIVKRCGPAMACLAVILGLFAVVAYFARQRELLAERRAHEDRLRLTRLGLGTEASGNTEDTGNDEHRLKEAIELAAKDAIPDSPVLFGCMLTLLEESPDTGWLDLAWLKREVDASVSTIAALRLKFTVDGKTQSCEIQWRHARTGNHCGSGGYLWEGGFPILLVVGSRVSHDYRPVVVMNKELRLLIGKEVIKQPLFVSIVDSAGRESGEIKAVLRHFSTDRPRGMLR